MVSIIGVVRVFGEAGMFDIGFVEMLVIAIVGMVVIGPERLPGVARGVGRSVGQLKRFLKNLQRQLEQEVQLDELKRSVRDEPPMPSPDEPSDEVEPPMPPIKERVYSTPAASQAPTNDDTEPTQSDRGDSKADTGKP